MSSENDRLLEWDNITWRDPSSSPTRGADDPTRGLLDRVQDRGPSRDWTGHTDDDVARDRPQARRDGERYQQPTRSEPGRQR